MQDTARRLFQNEELTSDDLKELLVLCKREAGIVVEGYEVLKPLPIPVVSFNVPDEAITLRIKAISEVKGINALAPRKPLEFGDASLSIVYGSNGSGKSGYIRILKHACGGRGLGILHGNVFESIQQPKICKISYSLGTTDKELPWTPTIGIHPDLRTVALYDMDCARVYVNSENEVTYEPRLLSYFRILVEVCEKVDEMIEAEILGKVSRKPILPPEYSMTLSGMWYDKITWQTSEEDINSKCSWNESIEAGLSMLNQRLLEKNPADKANELRKTKKYLTSFLFEIEELKAGLTYESFVALLAARTDAKDKHQAVDIDAKKALENILLDGIPSKSWRLLWEQARLYSESEAYKGESFPYIKERAICVLCQQPLNDEAKQRFSRFEAFVKSGLEAEASKAEKLLADIIEGKKGVPIGEHLETKLDLAGVSSEKVRQNVHSYCEVLSHRRDSFLSVMDANQLVAMPVEDPIRSLKELESKLEADAKAFEEDTKGAPKDKLKEKVKELNAQKWLLQQKGAITDEVERLNMVHLLDEAKKLANTTALSTKKSSLADELVTKAIKNKFKTELKNLGASRIKLDIDRTRTTKGQVYYQIKFKDNKTVNNAEILSEGEFRIVSLAAFLADVTANNINTPFIFDDPISSLDQDFEELAALRLVDLSKSRQVIVFTHRLSLLSMLEEAAEKAGIERKVVSLQRESWGTGEPNEPPLPAQKPKKALNNLIDHRLPKSIKVKTTEGNASYQVEAKALCSDIRITIERLIENDLLADVVQRFRRPITTMGKIEKLARIKLEDCKFLDAMMTKYSRYEHAQPNEAPVFSPEPDELTVDLQKLKAWLEEFTARILPVA